MGFTRRFRQPPAIGLRTNCSTWSALHTVASSTVSCHSGQTDTICGSILRWPCGEPRPGVVCRCNVVAAVVVYVCYILLFSEYVYENLPSVCGGLDRTHCLRSSPI